jgi:hypothetical protein
MDEQQQQRVNQAAEQFADAFVQAQRAGSSKRCREDRRGSLEHQIRNTLSRFLRTSKT